MSTYFSCSTPNRIRTVLLARLAMATSNAAPAAMPVRPKLVVFDLDACVWIPEMYQLWGGGGAPFVYDPATNTCKDTAGTTCRLLGAIPDVWDEVGQWGGKVAIASRTDEPSWARDLLCLFVTSSGQRLIDVVDPNLVEMYKGSKTDHLSNIQKKSGISYSDMIFFDDDPQNIRDVGSLGVLSVLTPQGGTREVWEKGLADYGAAQKK